MLYNYLAVGAGGAVGAMCRYAISLLPVLQRGPFPLATFLTNLVGAVLIGLVVGASQRWAQLSPTLLLFLRVGVCGGFTTFSTFSLESVTLFQNGKYLLGGAYILASVALCVAGVLLGQALARMLANA